MNVKAKNKLKANAVADLSNLNSCYSGIISILKGGTSSKRGRRWNNIEYNQTFGAYIRHLYYNFNLNISWDFIIDEIKPNRQQYLSLTNRLKTLMKNNNLIFVEATRFFSRIERDKLLGEVLFKRKKHMRLIYPSEYQIQNQSQAGGWRIADKGGQE